MRRNGFTLVEMLMVIVIIGIMIAAALPKLHDWSIGADVHGARTSARSMLVQARSLAIQKGVNATVSFSGGTATITTSVSGVVDTIGEPTSLSAHYGVTFTPSTWSVTFDPRGLGTNTNSWDVSFAKQGHTSGITIGPYGRVSQ